MQAALPELAERITAEPGWEARAMIIADAERAGHNPRALLTVAATRHELDTAESISDVLVWRLRRTADLPACAPTPIALGTSRANQQSTVARQMPTPSSHRAPRR